MRTMKEINKRHSFSSSKDRIFSRPSKMRTGKLLFSDNSSKNSKLRESKKSLSESRLSKRTLSRDSCRRKEKKPTDKQRKRPRERLRR